MPARSTASCLNSRTKRCFVFPQIWWRLGESNSWPPACKAGALPAELWPLEDLPRPWQLVGLGRFELPTSPLSGVRSNQLSYRPNRLTLGSNNPIAFRKWIKQFVWELMKKLMSSIKEVIQPQVPLRLPCYDFTPVMNHSVVTVPLAVRLATSGARCV